MRRRARRPARPPTGCARHCSRCWSADWARSTICASPICSRAPALWVSKHSRAARPRSPSSRTTPRRSRSFDAMPRNWAPVIACGCGRPRPWRCRRAEPFDLIFADPPYAPGSGSAAAAAVVAAGWLAPGGWLAVESARKDKVAADGLDLDVERDVGAARITLLRTASTPS